MHWRLLFFLNWAFPTCSSRFPVWTFNSSSAIFSMSCLSLWWISSPCSSNICCSCFNIVDILFEGVGDLSWMLLSARFISTSMRSVLGSTSSCRTWWSILGCRLLLWSMHWASFTITNSTLSITRRRDLHVWSRTSVSISWCVKAMIMLWRVSIIMFRRRYGSAIGRMSWRTSFDFACGEFFQVSDTRFKAFNTLLLASNSWSSSNTRSLRTRLLRGITSRWVSSWLCLHVLLWVLRSAITLRASCHRESIRCIIVFWIVHI